MTYQESLTESNSARERMYSAQRASDALWLAAYNESLSRDPGNYDAADVAGQTRVAGTSEQREYQAAAETFDAAQTTTCTAMRLAFFCSATATNDPNLVCGVGNL